MAIVYYLPTGYVNWSLPVKANVGATNVEFKIGLNGDERMEIPTTQKNLILWTGTSERCTDQFNVQNLDSKSGPN